MVYAPHVGINFVQSLNLRNTAQLFPCARYEFRVGILQHRYRDCVKAIVSENCQRVWYRTSALANAPSFAMHSVVTLVVQRITATVGQANNSADQACYVGSCAAWPVSASSQCWHSCWEADTIHMTVSPAQVTNSGNNKVDCRLCGSKRVWDEAWPMGPA